LDRSLAYDEWFKEWLNDTFPLGQGVETAKRDPIKNPWAIKADELNIIRPSSFPWTFLNLKKHSDKMDGKTAVFAMYLEFMQAHFESNDNGCLGTHTTVQHDDRDNGLRSPPDLFLRGQKLALLLVQLVAVAPRR